VLSHRLQHTCRNRSACWRAKRWGFRGILRNGKEWM